MTDRWKCPWCGASMYRCTVFPGLSVKGEKRESYLSWRCLTLRGGCGYEEVIPKEKQDEQG